MRALLRFFGLADDGGHYDRRAPAPAATPTTVGPGIKIKGELHGDGTLVVLGFFEGDIVLNGTLEVGADGRVEGNATARVIVVAGVVRGNLSADTRVDILPTGSLTGTVKSGSFAAADGATVKGEVWIERGGASAEVRA
jgi:cytoskeletal protein CcmA (bactofilin family)